jgi:serine/threonine protein kinase
MSQPIRGSDVRDERFGTVIDDKYVVGAVIGQGRAGTVYEGQAVGSGAPVALKLLRPTLSRSRMHVDRFLESARMTATVGHPAVVRVLDVGQAPGPTVYVAMERLAGLPLRRLLAERGPMPWSRARTIAVAVCEALSAAHEKELLHGALDPSRCFVLPGAGPFGADAVKVLDFGIAGEGSGPEIWPAAAAYRAPERRQGEPASARGDVFAAGALVFEMLVGRAPKPGESPRAAGLEIDDALDEAIAKALARDPSRRFRAAAALEEALTATGDASDRSSAPELPITGRTERPPSRDRSQPLDEEDITTVRPDRLSPSFPPPSAPRPAEGVPARPMSHVRPTPHQPEDPTPPPLLVPRVGSRPSPTAVPELEDRTSLLAGGFRLPAQENTSILPMPGAPSASAAAPVIIDDAPELTMVVEFRPPAAGQQTGIHAITNRPPGAPREETAVLDMAEIELQQGLASAVIGDDDSSVMREQTQVLGMALDDDGPSDPSISMTAVIEAPLGGRGVSGAIVTAESPVPTMEQLAAAGRSPMLSATPGAYALPPRHDAVAPVLAPPSGAHPAAPPMSGGYPPVSGGYPPVSGGYPPVSGGYPPVSGGYPPMSGGHPPMPSAQPASRPPRSGASIAVPSSRPPSSYARDRGMVVGVALGVLIAVAILGGGAIAGLWVASK